MFQPDGSKNRSEGQDSDGGKVGRGIDFMSHGAGLLMQDFSQDSSTDQQMESPTELKEGAQSAGMAAVAAAAAAQVESSSASSSSTGKQDDFMTALLRCSKKTNRQREIGRNPRIPFTQQQVCACETETGRQRGRKTDRQTDRQADR